MKASKVGMTWLGAILLIETVFGMVVFTTVLRRENSNPSVVLPAAVAIEPPAPQVITIVLPEPKPKPAPVLPRLAWELWVVLSWP